VNSSGRNKTWPKVSAVLLLMLCLASPAMLADEPTRSANDLENLVVQDCGSCHGLTLKGGLGPPLRPENLNHLPEAAVTAIISEGIPGTAMPPWRPLLAPADIEWISHQLKAGALVLP